MAQTAENHGATLLNYVGVTGLEKQNDLITGLTATDTLTNTDYQLKARVVINATGVFSIKFSSSTNRKVRQWYAQSGSAFGARKKFLKGPHAIMIPQTSDGRVLFMPPRHQHVVVGTTVLIDTTTAEPIPLEEEIDFILANAAAYMTQKPKRSDVKCFAGLRPLVAQGDKNERKKFHDITRSWYPQLVWLVLLEENGPPIERWLKIPLTPLFLWEDSPSVNATPNVCPFTAMILIVIGTTPTRIREWYWKNNCPKPKRKYFFSYYFSHYWKSNSMGRWARNGRHLVFPHVEPEGYF